MTHKNIIEEIERRYAHYILSDSDTMLYYRTRDFLNYMQSYEIVREIIRELTQKHPYKEGVLKDEKGYYKLPDQLMASIANGREEYVSFVIHFLSWIFEEHNHDTTKFYDDAWWTCPNNRDYTKKERIRLFQQDVILPIVTYVVDRLRQGLYISKALERFAVRAMRFKCLSGVKNEREVQDRIAMYLFDIGRENHREENSGNGNPDFLISDEDGLFVVEVKFINNNSRKGVKAFAKWTSQLRDYMEKYSSHQGILFIVTRQHIEFVWKDTPQNMSIMNVYIGDKNPSELGAKRRIEI